MTWIMDIKKRTLKPEAPINSGKSDKLDKISFDDLVFIPAQLANTPIDYFTEKISSETIIGKSSKHPLKLEVPIMIAAMSFGALSKEAKLALAKASTIAKTADNTGEGGMLPEQREHASILIAQYSTGRFGVDEEYLKKADAIEVKLGQGAKPGQGGLLPASKITDEIAEIRKVSKDKDIHSPARHFDISNIDELKERIEHLRKITGGKPIFLKLGAGNVEKDVELAVKANPDVIVIDGMEGGTGAAPEVLLNDVGLPTIPAIVRARRIMDELGASQELVVGGNMRKGSDVAKALALGIDAVIMGFPLLVAMGCNYCRNCYLGKCPVGITTQDENLRENLDVDKEAEHVSNFILACTEEVKMVAGVAGKDDIHGLNKDDLIALTSEMSRICGVKFVSES